MGVPRSVLTPSLTPNTDFKSYTSAAQGAANTVSRTPLVGASNSAVVALNATDLDLNTSSGPG